MVDDSGAGDGKRVVSWIRRKPTAHPRHVVQCTTRMDVAATPKKGVGARATSARRARNREGGLLVDFEEPAHFT